MNEITTVGLDLAKRVVSLCGEDATGRVVMQRVLRREAVLGWFVQRPPCLLGMEACASAHWFARELAALGHTARQYSTGGKPRLGRITRRGDTYLRSLLVQGARSALQAALRAAPTRRTRLAAWIVTTYERIGYHKTLVAIANKHARLLWVLLTRDGPLRAHAVMN